MSQIIEAIYEEGVLKPLEPLNLGEHARVRILIEIQEHLRQQAEEILTLARASCEGLSEEELAIMEGAKLNGTHFFSHQGESK